jgi:hypothetical protein
MRSLAACAFTAWAIAGTAASAAAQPAVDTWWHIRRLQPGTEIAVVLKGGDGPGRRYFLAASDSELMTLNLTGPQLPRAAKNVLKDVAETNPQFLIATSSGSTLTDDDVHLGPTGIFVGSEKVGELAQVIERVSREDVITVTRAGGAPLVLNRQFEVGLAATGVLTAPAIGGDLRLTVSIPVTDRHSIEVFAGPFSGDSSNFDEDIKAFYGVQVRQTLPGKARPGVEPFISYGAVGIISKYQEYFTCALGRVCTPHTETHAYPPLVGLIGGGVQYALKPRLAVRIEANGFVALILPIGGRFSVGFTIPVGGRPYVLQK